MESGKREDFRASQGQSVRIRPKPLNGTDKVHQKRAGVGLQRRSERFGRDVLLEQIPVFGLKTEQFKKRDSLLC